MKEKNLYTNRLAKEKSPYLLQHAHNPVDWYPWGEEAFKTAKQLDKPIFLSIGYATCHWCHVMEKESFEDVEVARLMNDTFINIKVDREELPQVDSLYMEFAQTMMAGAAGWPLNLLLTPALEPFFAATYLPPRSAHNLMGLLELITRIHEVWKSEERDHIELQARKIVELIEENLHSEGDQLPEKEILDDAADFLFKLADPVYGGMKGQPKFPIPYQYNFLMSYFSKMKDARALFLVERTLEMMHRGGIYDHLGGGFSRYSVDEKWFLPHFEKMLYDNALLANAYTEAWQITKRNLYRQVCDETLNYLLREMSHTEGGFYSAEDADSEGREGYYYTWSQEEVQSLLGKKESKFFCQFYDISEEGNFEGRNILHTTTSLEDFAHTKGLDPNDLAALFSIQKKILLRARDQRIHPLKDDKILCSWNSLAIYSMAYASYCPENMKYLHAAQASAHYIKKCLWKEGVLFRRWRENEAAFEACLEEYAFLIRGLLALFESDGDSEWLEWALQLTSLLRKNYKSENGAYFQTNGLDEHIILRRCQFSDGAEPSGNAIHCENLLKLYQMTNNATYLQDAEDILKMAEKYIDHYPPGYCYHLMNLNRYFDKQAPTIVIALNHDQVDKNLIFTLLNSHYIRHRAVLWSTAENEKLFSLIPHLKNYVPINNQTTLYICFNGVCTKPLTLFSEIQEAILSLV